MPKFKSDVKVGDIIHIYHAFGAADRRGSEGVVTKVTDTAIYGTWDSEPLFFDDDWETLEEKE